jgi:hypothetical protein
LADLTVAVADLRREVKPQVLDKLTMREINAEVSAARRERGAKK